MHCTADGSLYDHDNFLIQDLRLQPGLGLDSSEFAYCVAVPTAAMIRSFSEEAFLSAHVRRKLRCSHHVVLKSLIRGGCPLG